MRVFLISVLVLAALGLPAGAQAAEEPRPLAADECGLAETTETHDLTLSDAPWVDLCAVTIEPAAGSAITVVTHVAGSLRERVPNASWAPTLRVDDCIHTVVVEDGDTVGAIDARVESRCGENPQPCTGIFKTITDLIGGVCATASTWDHEETFVLVDNVVTFTDTGVRVTLDPDRLSPLLATALAPRSVITSVSALSSGGVSANGDRAALDFDVADSTGRRYTIPAE